MTRKEFVKMLNEEVVINNEVATEDIETAKKYGFVIVIIDSKNQTVHFKGAITDSYEYKFQNGKSAYASFDSYGFILDKDGMCKRSILGRNHNLYLSDKDLTAMTLPFNVFSILHVPENNQKSDKAIWSNGYVISLRTIINTL